MSRSLFASIECRWIHRLVVYSSIYQPTISGCDVGGVNVQILFKD
jgi:hypothetical protein